MQKRKGDEPRAHLLFWLCGSGLGARKPANDVLPVNRTMKKYKICVTIILNFLALHFFLGDEFFARGIDRNLIIVKK